MRIAIISDIHGNLVAFETVLADLQREKPDKIVCLGDVALTGPQPHETIERLRALHCPVIMGNCDDWLLDPQPFEVNDEDRRRIRDIDFWCVKQLSPADLDYIRTFRPTIEITLGGDATLLCFHGSPKSNMDHIGSTTPDEELEGMLAGFHANIMAGGHTHHQMLRHHKDLIIINPGSVGLPHERVWQTNQAYNPSRAEYALVSWKNGSLGIELRRVPLDLEAVKRAALDSDMPHAQWWAGDWR